MGRPGRKSKPSSTPKAGPVVTKPRKKKQASKTPEVVESSDDKSFHLPETDASSDVDTAVNLESESEDLSSLSESPAEGDFDAIRLHNIKKNKLALRALGLGHDACTLIHYLLILSCINVRKVASALGKPQGKPKKTTSKGKEREVASAVEIPLRRSMRPRKEPAVSTQGNDTEMGVNDAPLPTPAVEHSIVTDDAQGAPSTASTGSHHSISPAPHATVPFGTTLCPIASSGSHHVQTDVASMESPIPTSPGATLDGNIAPTAPSATAPTSGGLASTISAPTTPNLDNSAVDGITQQPITEDASPTSAASSPLQLPPSSVPSIPASATVVASRVPSNNTPEHVEAVPSKSLVSPSPTSAATHSTTSPIRSSPAAAPTDASSVVTVTTSPHQSSNKPQQTIQRDAAQQSNTSSLVTALSALRTALPTTITPCESEAGPDAEAVSTTPSTTVNDGVDQVGGTLTSIDTIFAGLDVTLPAPRWVVTYLKYFSAQDFGASWIALLRSWVLYEWAGGQWVEEVSIHIRPLCL